MVITRKNAMKINKANKTIAIIITNSYRRIFIANAII